MVTESTIDLRDEDRAFAFAPAGGAAHTPTIGVLCIHGFTGTPLDLRPLGQALAGGGIAAQGPVLPGHGELPGDLKRCRWRDWVEAARDALRRMVETHDHVFVAGLSMGGLITLHLAASEMHCASSEGRQLPLRGIIVLSAPSAINDPRARLVRFARHVVRWHYPLRGADFSNPAVRAEVLKRANGKAINFDDPRVRREIVASARIPVSAIHELIQLNQVVMRELPRVRVPALFVQGRKDTVIAPDSADALAAGIGSADKSVAWMPNSGHMLPQGPDASAMFTQIAAFVRAHV